MSPTVTRRTPTPEEHRRLSEPVGRPDALWLEAMSASLVGSTCDVVVHHNSGGEFVGMGRVVRNGAFYFYLDDVAMHPNHQGCGLGRAIVGGSSTSSGGGRRGTSSSRLRQPRLPRRSTRSWGGGTRRWSVWGRPSGTEAGERGIALQVA